LTENNPPLLPLQNMADRHQALTPALAGSYLEAARVCLDRHHVSPKEFTLANDRVESIAKVEWELDRKLLMGTRSRSNRLVQGHANVGLTSLLTY
jgi:hypothetical protein